MHEHAIVSNNLAVSSLFLPPHLRQLYPSPRLPQALVALLSAVERVTVALSVASPVRDGNDGDDGNDGTTSADGAASTDGASGTDGSSPAKADSHTVVCSFVADEIPIASHVPDGARRLRRPSRGKTHDPAWNSRRMHPCGPPHRAAPFDRCILSSARVQPSATDAPFGEKEIEL